MDYNFTASLSFKISLEQIDSCIEDIEQNLIPQKFEYFFTFDKKNGWIYFFSNYFEIISKSTIQAINQIFSKYELGIFLNILDKSNYCILMKHTEKTEYLGKNLWDFPLNNSKYIFIQNIILAPFKSFDDNVLSLKKISEILKINTRYLFSGFDKSKKNNNSKYGKLSIPKNIIRKKDMVSIISQEGIYSFTRQQLINLEEICSLYKDVKLLFGKDIQILANFKTIFEIYIIVNRDLILEFEYKNQKKIYNEDVIVRITNFNFDYFKLLNISKDIITIAVPRQLKCYDRYTVKKFGITKTNTSGIEKISSDIFVYTHSKRRCPWTNKESEWNIDSISSLSVPYPVISVSRKNFLNSHQQEMEFKLLRQEEVGHTHPSFIEIYFCIKGQLQLEININKTVKKICLDESNILVIMPNIPHHIANVKFIDNRYAHTCIQLLSKFHYPFHSTKRNYEFSSIDIHRSN